MAAWCILPPFFWLRGIWRDNKADRIVGGCLLALFGVLSLEVFGATDGLNMAAAWIFLLGCASLVAGPVGRTMRFRQVLPYGILLILVALMMAMAI